MDGAGPGDGVPGGGVQLEEGAGPGDGVPGGGVQLEGGVASRAWAGPGACTLDGGTRAASSSLFWVLGLSQSRGTGQQPGSWYSRPNLSPVSVREVECKVLVLPSHSLRGRVQLHY